ncbi:MAG TPA: MarR family transcriptional regulator, partial [Anaerolineae bacterium]|nr:MarR family transcriptional regulator [Anaerolineae bacterium]
DKMHEGGVVSSEPRRDRVHQILDAVMHLTWAGHKQFASELSQLGLTPPQFFALAFITHQVAGCPIHRVAEATYQERATMTGILDRLERAGLIQRERSHRDRRQWIITPTDAGKEIIARVTRWRLQSLEEALADFTQEELDELHRLLSKLLVTSPFTGSHELRAGFCSFVLKARADEVSEHKAGEE